MTTPQNPNLRPSEAGFILPLVLIIVAIGAMVVIGLLGYASGLLRAGGEDADALQELYAADAGITHVKKLLEQGALMDDIPPIEVNGLEVKMVVTPVGSLGSSVPTPQPRPIDPELPPDFLEPHRVTLNSVPEGTKVDISWAFTQLTPTPTPIPTLTPMPTPTPDTPGPSPTPTPTPTPTPIPTYPSIIIYGAVGTATPVASTEPLRALIPGAKRWLDLRDIELPDAETYVVDFDPGTISDLVSDPFTQDCGSPTEPLFCMATPPMDYIVVSTAGRTTVTAYLRQMPRWKRGHQGGLINYTFSGGGEVYTLSWKPYPPDE